MRRLSPLFPLCLLASSAAMAQDAKPPQNLEGLWVAYSGNAVNGLAPGGRRFLAPDPHVGAFKKAIRDRLSAKGIATRFVDTWPIPHLGSGELHCMTNARRDLGDGRWFAGPDATPRSARRGDPR